VTIVRAKESTMPETKEVVVESVTLRVRISCVTCPRQLDTSETLAGDAVRTGNTTQRASYWLDGMKARLIGAADARHWERREDGYHCAHCIASEEDHVAGEEG
jgi:hypothetical protein